MLPRPDTLNSPLKNSFFVGDEVTSLKFPWFLKAKLETPYVHPPQYCYGGRVVSYFLNRLLNQPAAGRSDG
jgi:hypothetical protein